MRSACSSPARKCSASSRSALITFPPPVPSRSTSAITAADAGTFVDRVHPCVPIPAKYLGVRPRITRSSHAYVPPSPPRGHRSCGSGRRRRGGRSRGRARRSPPRRRSRSCTASRGSPSTSTSTARRRSPNFQPGKVAGPLSLPEGSYDIALTKPGDDRSSRPSSPSTTPRYRAAPTSAWSRTSPRPASRRSPRSSTTSASSTPGQARLIVRHTAAAPAVDVRAGGKPVFDRASPTRKEAKADLPAGTVSADVVLAGTDTVVLGPADLNLKEGTVHDRVRGRFGRRQDARTWWPRPSAGCTRPRAGCRAAPAAWPTGVWRRRGTPWRSPGSCWSGWARAGSLVDDQRHSRRVPELPWTRRAAAVGRPRAARRVRCDGVPCGAAAGRRRSQRRRPVVGFAVRAPGLQRRDRRRRAAHRGGGPSARPGCGSRP